MDAVIDTKVLVSAALCPRGPTAEILDMVLAGQIVPVFDDRVLREYDDVMRRAKFSFPARAVDDLLSSIRTLGTLITPARVKSGTVDEKDMRFYECALATQSKILITGNKRHFPVSGEARVRVSSEKWGRTILLPLAGRRSD